MSDDFAGRRILVTGGASGVGEACVNHFLGLGALVASLDVKDCTRDDDHHLHLVADLRDHRAVSAAVAEVAERFKGLDTLVNNAGVSFVGAIEDGTEEDWNRLWDINVMGYVRSTRAALPLLRESDSAAIVNISSLTATSGLRQRAAYTATKGAIESMTRAVAADLVAEGITVNAVNPGTVDTPFMAELAARADDPVQRRADFDSRQPIGRMVTPLEVAHAVAYFAHPLSRSTTGSTLMVDGGIFNLHMTRA
ncbi:SDR family oxidoreductase [Mycobacterium sp. 21AC1]|uniref:SDR family NAD(P)-dependent oxidoreductase n=1 Tax=[Mycobacterium] appelbergii TaxID=2939269 RepID=UPI00293937C4|nr:SDR family oxidoreductase [Mycobacterium sp. 21AC1]MDV3127344.1 SDR family oxidoreductase [Mycobacterium sp. 21AC1]